MNTTSRRLRAYITATHPAPTAAVTIIVAIAAVSVGHGWSALLLAAAVFAGQLSVGWSNDWIDASIDRQINRVSKPVVAGAVTESDLRMAAGAALLTAVVLSLATGRTSGVLHLVAVASAWSYNLGLKRTWFSPVPYAVSFGIVPAAYVVAALPGSPQPRAWGVIAGSLLGVGAHFLNTLPDFADDQVTGSRGLPQRLPYAVTAVLGQLLVSAGVVVALAATQRLRLGMLAFVVVTTAAVGAGIFTGRQRIAFASALITAVACVAVIAGSGRLLISAS